MQLMRLNSSVSGALDGLEVDEVSGGDDTMAGDEGVSNSISLEDSAVGLDSVLTLSMSQRIVYVVLTRFLEYTNWIQSTPLASR